MRKWSIILALAAFAGLCGQIQAAGPAPFQPLYDGVAPQSIWLSTFRGETILEPAVTPDEVAIPETVVSEPLCSNLGADSCSQSRGLGAAAACDCWNLKVIPYGWLYELHGRAGVRGLTADVDISTRKMLDLLEHDVDFVAMGRMELENGPCTVLFDGYYVKADLEQEVRRFDFSSTFEEAIVELALAYEIESMPELLSLPPCSKFQVLAGGRYQLLKGGATITGPLGGTATFEGAEEWVDPIVGGRIITPISPWMTLQVRGDVGGFGWGDASEFTWNFEALLNYQCTECCNLMAGYRILDVDYEKGSGTNRFLFDVQFRGPMAGIEFVF